MKKAILLSILALLICVLIACRTGTEPSPDSTPEGTERTVVSEPERTRVPVSHSTLPPLPETTEQPEPTAEPDPSLFQPETFDETPGDTLGKVTDQPGFGQIGR